MSMTVSGQDSKQCGSILREVEGCAATHQNIHCHAGDIELVSQAHATGMSLGKYQAFLILQQYDPSVTEEQVQGLSMRQIRQLIDSYTEQNAPSDAGQDDSSHSDRGNRLPPPGGTRPSAPRQALCERLMVNFTGRSMVACRFLLL